MATGLFNLKQVNQAISQGAWSGYIAPKWVEYLVVAGGGAGGSRTGGGGGAGGLLTGIVTVAAGTSYTVTVGAGATGAGWTTQAPNGSNSVFGSISALGGGGAGGGGNGAQYARAGGSGGGGGGNTVNIGIGGQGTAGQGNAGGTYGSATSNQSGGGGAGTVGLNGSSSVTGNGGAGIASAITGTVVTYAGGGGAGSNGGTAGVGGVGGGANGTTNDSQPRAATANTGGGGGGGGFESGFGDGGSGGSGIVVVRYPGNVQFYTGGTVTYSNGYIVHNFTSSGTLAPTTPTIVSEYQISRSLRFNSADSTYLNRTPASAGNRKTWTWSAWVKRSALSSGQIMFAAESGAENIYLYISPGDLLTFYVTLSSGNLNGFPNANYRDVGAWYHFVFAFDTTQTVAANRCKTYVNGQQVTLTNTPTFSQNADGPVNSTVPHYMGTWAAASAYLNGYMTEINFIDGQALPPTSFGYVNPSTGVWSPAKFIGSYGTNGFYLNFSDNSNTTAATLGKDYSGNGNNWTPNNFSVTAGAGNDSLVDSPTSYGTDTGVGGTVRGNYATLNPLIKPVGTVAYSNGNLDATNSTSNWNAIGGTIGISTGKWYWEYISGGQNTFFGIQVPSINFSSGNPQDANAAAGSVLLCDDNQYQIDYNARVAYTSTSHPSGTVVGVAVDMDAGTIVFYLNGTSQGSITWTSSAAYGKTVIPMAIAYNSGYVTTANFGQRPFAYTAPSGYKALCTQNLPTPTIGATSTTLATQYFAPVTYAGLGATQTVTVGFQPDFTWIKNRTLGANWHVLTDSVRGVQKEIYTNSTAAEATLTTSGVNQFNASGFQILGNTNDYNGSTSNYVAWNWRASNATAVTNTAGSITSTVSANTTSGFSVVTYTGTGANATVGHGLGVAPSMVIVKGRNTVSNWVVWHSTFSGDGYILLNSTGGQSTGATIWNSTVPTSTVFSVGTNLSVNESGDPKVAYVFAPVAGYSKFGSYTGNGSADGPFVFTGFRPAFVMFKISSGVDSWMIYDSKRNTYNVVNNQLYPNSSGAESAAGASFYVDFVSNGFKVRATDTLLNGNGSTYIFAAFAEAPLKFSLAR